ncbi:hypothetical protein ACFFTN_13280 [Aminobacter aganoensis]|uniref:MobA/VirD2-like nuclease domain-containing protein n=1 Tax=Aminobacter aganoensis TaxID=83264 RepID=A0A7X0FA21_9HYPH|nr:hypothetical protein [Aminobacter aganoensis]MBB6355714.1 hypothetical protein [Aminobacter aganoensis]
MEILPGAFEKEWERRRAVLKHEMQIGQADSGDWDEPRRGGVARIGDEGFGGFGRALRRRSGGGLRSMGGSAGSGSRPMRQRFSALARGSQPAVVKLASYGGGGRAAAMMNYTSRGGELAVENERGERISGRDALAGERAEWEHLFDNRAASRDLSAFHVSVDARSLRDDVDQDDQLREILRTGFGDRRFVYAARERAEDELHVSGVVVLRDGAGERLTGDRKAAEIIRQRYDDTEVGRDVEARFRFHGYGNGVEWGTARVRELVASSEGDVRDNTGRLIGDATQAGDLVQKEWRRELHSRKGRDVMHLIVSARAGTDAAAFEGAVREFLGEQFAGHRYVFAVHDPALDPKDMAEGGKRPHIHAHAIVTMRSETGERIVTSPQLFRDWRAVMAEKAREQGIDMELTDRREFANAPAYTRNQVRPVSYHGRTEHEGTSPSAHSRYQAKRANEIHLATSERSRQYVAAAVETWNDLANEEHGTREGAFARQQRGRLEAFAEIYQKDQVFEEKCATSIENVTNMVELSAFVKGEDGQMREMTRPEFEAYEKRVEAVLASVAQTVDATDRADFNEVAAAAREVVDIRREYLEQSERLADFGVGWPSRDDRDRLMRSREESHHLRDAADPQSAGHAGREAVTEGPWGDQDRQRADGQTRIARDNLFDDAVTRHGERAVREGDEILADYDAAFRSLDHATSRFSNSRRDVSAAEREAIRADYFAASNRYDTVLKTYARDALDGNTYLYEQSKGEENLQEALKEEAQDRASRRAIDMHDPSRNLPARQHDEQAVRAGDELFERIDAARREVDRLYEPVRLDGRSAAFSDPVETQAEHGRRIEKLSEAEARHTDLLREAAQAALDGNGYIRDQATIRHDLNNEIHMESRRRVEAEQGRDENEPRPLGSPEREEGAARLHEESRADPPQQHVPRLRQVELEVEERQDRERDDRER